MGGGGGQVSQSTRGGSGQSADGGGQVSQLTGGGQVSQLMVGGGGVSQDNEYSLHGGRYASCVHTGGLSC